MKTDPKLAPFKGTRPNLPIVERVGIAWRGLGARLDRTDARPLRDVDRWSDQTEVAFVEERCAGRG